MLSDAPQVVTDRPCYSAVAPLHISGSGFTPGGPLTVTGTWITGRGRVQMGPVFHLTADATGAFTQDQAIPEIADPGEALQLTVDDAAQQAQGGPVPSALAVVRVVRFGARYGPWNTDGPARARPGRRAVVYTDGFIGGGRYLYLHYVLAGRAVKTVRIGRLHGPCGTLTARIREFAFRPRPAGTYTPRFDTSPDWPNATAWSRYKRVVLSQRDAIGVTAPARRGSAGRP